MPSGLSSRDVLWTATPSDTYRTGKTKLTDGIHAGRSSAVPQIDEVLPRSYRFSAGLQRPDRQPSARNRAGAGSGRGTHRTFDASSASAERSPLVSVMCPARRSCLNLFTTWTSPLLVESTYGLSIWYGSPVRTI